MEAILSKMKEVVENPNAAVKKYKSETGKKAIGCFPVYCPERNYTCGWNASSWYMGRTNRIRFS